MCVGPTKAKTAPLGSLCQSRMGTLSLPHTKRAEPGSAQRRSIKTGSAVTTPKECGGGWARNMMCFHPDFHKSVAGNFNE